LLVVAVVITLDPPMMLVVAAVAQVDLEPLQVLVYLNRHPMLLQ
jgi:hypothetical protein